MLVGKKKKCKERKKKSFLKDLKFFLWVSPSSVGYYSFITGPLRKKYI
jgi:hypothetical protein